VLITVVAVDDCVAKPPVEVIESVAIILVVVDLPTGSLENATLVLVVDVSVAEVVVAVHTRSPRSWSQRSPS
jgi:hypothetical protein